MPAYKPPKTGIDGIAAKFDQINRRLDALSAAAGMKSARVGGGIFEFLNDGGNAFASFGDIPTVRFQDGEPVDDTIQGVQIKGPDGDWLFTAIHFLDLNENQVAIGDDNDATALDIFSATAQVVDLTADNYMRLTAPRIELAVPSVGAADFALGYDWNGSNYTVAIVTSARKYKQDIQPAEVDPDAVLDIEPVTFRDKSAVESNPDAKTNFGVIADQLHALGLGDHLVTYNAEGEVEAAKYDRIGVALIPAVRKLRDRVDEQDKIIAALTARLDALEG